jgi:acyl-CoA thioester hydrolase
MSGDAFHFSTSIQIRFRDFDAFGHVNNAVYFTYMEMARTEYFTHVGVLKMEQSLSFTGNERPPVFFILAEAACQFKAPIQTDTQLIVKTRVHGLRNSSFAMEYHFVDQVTGQIVAIGRTINVTYDYGAGRSGPMPDEWRQAIEAFEEL